MFEEKKDLHALAGGRELPQGCWSELARAELFAIVTGSRSHKREIWLGEVSTMGLGGSRKST